MAHIEPIPEDALKRIAQQIGERMPRGLADVYAREPPPVLSESLPVVELPMEEVRAGRTRLSGRVRQTGRWHHQIRRGAEVNDYAMTTAPGARNPDWRVVAVGRSALPATIDSAVTLIDERASGDPTVRLLSIPDYNTTVLWLEHPDRDEIVVAYAPSRKSKFRNDVIYEASDFLKLLSARPPSSGVPSRGLRGPGGRSDGRPR